MKQQQDKGIKKRSMMKLVTKKNQKPRKLIGVERRSEDGIEICEP